MSTGQDGTGQGSRKNLNPTGTDSRRSRPNRRPERWSRRTRHYGGGISARVGRGTVGAGTTMCQWQESCPVLESFMNLLNFGDPRLLRGPRGPRDRPIVPSVGRVPNWVERVSGTDESRTRGFVVVTVGDPRTVFTSTSPGGLDDRSQT